MRFDNLADWLAWQETLSLNEIELGLDRCQSVADRMDLGQPKYGFVSVSGTNGKGSSVAMLSTIMRQAGYKTGIYTSPHLIDYNERIRIDGENISDELLCEAFESIDQARGDTLLTYFEFGTLAAFYLFEKLNVDFAVFEVGLGGRLDAVNMMDADVALVTSIAIDHVDWLGDNRNAISLEKAGIMRSGHSAVCSDPDVPEALVEFAKDNKVDLYLTGSDFQYEFSADNWTWSDNKTIYKDLPRPSLRGDFQLMNAAGVLKVIQCLPDRYKVSEDDIRNGLQQTKLAGRFQVIPGDVEYVLDVAHNPHAAKILANFLKANPVKGKNHILIGMLKDKDASGVIDEVGSYVDDWHVAGLGGSRGTGSERLVRQLKDAGVDDPVFSYDSVAAAYAALQKISQPGDRVLVAGSFLTVSAVMKTMEQEP